jgi:hypothetical protein
VRFPDQGGFLDAFFSRGFDVRLRAANARLRRMIEICGETTPVRALSSDVDTRV